MAVYTSRRSLFLFSTLLCFVVAMGIRLGTYHLYTAPETSLFPDSYTYTNLADYMQESGSFRYSPEHAPEISRTPGYPLYLALLNKIAGHSITTWVVGNCLAVSLGIVLCMLSFSRFYGRTAAAIGGVILACDPCMVYISTIVLSEALFFPLITLAAILFAFSLDTGSLRKAVAFGIVLAASAYVRPISLLLIFPCVSVLAIVLSRRQSVRQGITAAGLAMLAWLCCILPWSIRNHNAHDTYQFSTISSYNLYFYRAAGVIATSTGQDLATVQKTLAVRLDEETKGLNEVERTLQAGRKAIPIILDHPKTYMDNALEAWKRMLNSNMIWTIWDMVDTKAAKENVFIGISYLEHYGRMLIACLLLLGLALKRPWQGMEAASVLFIAYFLVVSAGPEAYGRFRSPLTALAVFPALGLGFSLLRQIRKPGGGAKGQA